MAFIFYYMNYLLKWTVSNNELLSLALKIVCNLYLKVVLILLLLEVGDIEMKPSTYYY